MDKASVTSQLFMGGMGDTILVNLGKYKIQMFRNTVSFYIIYVQSLCYYKALM